MEIINQHQNQVFMGGLKWDLELSGRLGNPIYLENHGYQVFSQSDEDGITQEIFKRIGVTDKRFIEFGVHNGLVSNCHYLLHKGWSGLWIEGSQLPFEEIRLAFKSVIQNNRLKAVNEFITKDNINEIFKAAGFTGEIDLLSVDIDGNDYHVWKAINVINPRVVIVEYNAKFPSDCEWIMPYKADYVWDGSDKQGASLKSLELLGIEKGYSLVGTNLSGVNAFFVRSELVKNLFPSPATSENLYNPPRWNYTWKTGHPARCCLADDENYLNESAQDEIIRKKMKMASENIKSRAVVIWGMGDGFNYLQKHLMQNNINNYLCYDSLKAKYYYFNKKSILTDLSLLNPNNHYVIITPLTYFGEMESALIEKGFSKNTDYIFANLYY